MKIETRIEVEAMYRVPIALSEAVGETFVHGSCGIKADKILALSGIENIAQNVVGLRQPVRVPALAGLRIGVDEEMGIVLFAFQNIRVEP